MLIPIIKDKIYNFEGHGVIPLLPYKIAQKNNGEVVVGSNETAEHCHELQINACILKWRGRSCLFDGLWFHRCTIWRMCGCRGCSAGTLFLNYIHNTRYTHL